MSEFKHNVGDSVVLSLSIIDYNTPTNNPIIGENPTVAIRRLSDDKWYNFNTNSWDTYVGYENISSLNKQNLEDNNDGTYTFLWDQSIAENVVNEYSMIYENISVNYSGISYDLWCFTDLETTLNEIEENITDIKNNIGLIDGGNIVNITCQDENSNKLYLSRLTIKNSAQTSTIALSETDINGIATFGLVDGSYKIIVSSKPGYNPTNPYTLTVRGTTNLTIIIPTISYNAPMDGVTLATLVDRMRIYIDDKGTNVSQGVIGFPDGNRKIFMLHHMNIDDDSLILTINGTQSTAWVLYDNKIVFTSAPALNSAIIADYIYYEYNDDILEQCVRRSIGFLDKTIDLGWGNMDVYENWDVTMNYSEEDIILTCCVLELLQMQIVRMPIALSFGDVGARISLRGAATERTKAASELKQILYDKIREYRTYEIDSNLIT